MSAQVALSLPLLIAGSMFVRGALHSLSDKTGYDSKQVVAVDLQFPDGSGYNVDRKLSLIRRLRERLTALPGVMALSIARPPDNISFQTVAMPTAPRGSNLARQARLFLHYTFVQPNYFATLGIQLLAGRAFSRNGGVSDRSAILSQSAAQQLWPGQNPVGRTLRLGAIDEHSHNLRELSADSPAYQVIGVARDTRGVEFDGGDSKQVYLRLPDEQIAGHPLLVRTRSDPARLIKAIDPVIASVDPDLPVAAATLDEMLRQSPAFITASLAAAIASTLGLLGLLLASMGVYGTVNYLVVLRTREIGIRIAIGGQRQDILRLVFRESARPVLTGIVTGTALAAGMSHLLHSALQGLIAADSLSFFGMSLLFLAIAMAAVYPPARRAMRVDPMVALRHE